MLLQELLDGHIGCADSIGKVELNVGPEPLGIRGAQLLLQRSLGGGADPGVILLLMRVGGRRSSQEIEWILDQVQDVDRASQQLPQRDPHSQRLCAGGRQIGRNKDLPRSPRMPRLGHPHRTGTVMHQGQSGVAEQDAANPGLVASPGDDEVVPLALDLLDDLLHRLPQHQAGSRRHALPRRLLDQMRQHLVGELLDGVRDLPRSLVPDLVQRCPGDRQRREEEQVGGIDVGEPDGVVDGLCGVGVEFGNLELPALGEIDSDQDVLEALHASHTSKGWVDREASGSSTRTLN